MKNLLLFANHTPLFIVELLGERAEQEYLESIGIKPESMITMISNPSLKNSSQPVIIEVHDARFMLDQDIAKNIIALHALEDQNIIFKGNKTPQRMAILEILKSFSHHFTLPELTQKVQEQFPEMGEITIYRSLKVLVEKNIVQEISLPQERKKYEVCKGHHEHIFCQNCGHIIEFYDAEMESMQKRIMKEHGATLLSRHVTLIASSCAYCLK